LFDTQDAERFIQNAQVYAKVTNEKLPPGLSQDDVTDRMRANVSICRQLMLENNNFIDSCLSPFFSEPKNIDNEDAIWLLDFARRLHNPIYSNEDKRLKLDSFLALEIYKALVKKEEEAKNIELLIKCWFGIGDIYYLLSGSLYSPESVNATKKAMELAEKAGGYFALKDKNARLCAAACYNQLAISTYNSREAGYEEKFNAIDSALAFYNRDDAREADSDFPWQSWIDDVNGNIYYMGIHYEFMKCIGPITPDLAERVYSFNRAYFNAEELTQLDSDDDTVCSSFIDKAINTTDSEKWIHCIEYIIPAYHSGHIDLQRYVKMLSFCLHAHAAFLRTSPEFMTELFRYDMMMVISAILARNTKNHGIGTYLFDYLHKLPREILDVLPSSKEELKTIAENTLDMSNRQSYIDALLKSTTHNHLPTYVHSMMVSHLMTCFVSWFIENRSEKLIGICGAKNSSDVIEKSALILEETRLAGLAHDIGKIAYIQAVSVISRRLTDGEFDLIKRHTDEGWYYLESRDFGCIPDVIRGHQKTNDGKSGYPRDFDNTASPYKFMIDICSASDCIDAATDNIGRSYQQNKTGNEIMDEIMAQSPDRYNPEIAIALRDEKLRESINNIIQHKRKECYYKAYCEFSNSR
jgi:response regulator RpfG family c-di-GMP phosphodiesterase